MVIPISQWCRQAKKTKFGFQQVFADLLFCQLGNSFPILKVNNKKAILILCIFGKDVRGRAHLYLPEEGNKSRCGKCKELREAGYIFLFFFFFGAVCFQNHTDDSGPGCKSIFKAMGGQMGAEARGRREWKLL